MQLGQPAEQVKKRSPGPGYLLFQWPHPVTAKTQREQETGYGYENQPQRSSDFLSRPHPRLLKVLQAFVELVKMDAQTCKQQRYYLMDASLSFTLCSSTSWLDMQVVVCPQPVLCSYNSFMSSQFSHCWNWQTLAAEGGKCNPLRSESKDLQIAFLPSNHPLHPLWLWLAFDQQIHWQAKDVCGSSTSKNITVKPPSSSFVALPAKGSSKGRAEIGSLGGVQFLSFERVWSQS